MTGRLFKQYLFVLLFLLFIIMMLKFKFQDIVKKQQPQQNIKNDIKLSLRPPIYKKQGVTLYPGTQQILLPSFVMLILGKPGSGKSHLINELIDQQQFYKFKFDRILYIGPTKYSSTIQDEYNWSPSLDVKFIDAKIKQCTQWCENLLIIMDDVISQLTNQKTRFQQLFFNRRHQLKKGTISFIITSQKFTSVPTWIRTTINTIFSYAITKNQIKILFNEIPIMTNQNMVKNKFQTLNKYQFIYFNIEKAKAFDFIFNQI